MPRSFSIPLAFALLFVFQPFFAFSQHEQQIQAFITEGKNYRDAGEYEKSLTSFNNALLLDLKHDQANYLMALSYYNLGRFNECVLHADKAISFLSAYDEEAYMLRGKALLKATRWEEAAISFDKMLLEYPENVNAYYYKGKAFEALNKYDEAESAYQWALSLSPNFAKVHLAMGNMMIDKGEPLKAVLALTNYLLLEPRGKQSMEVYTKLQKQVPKAFGSLSSDMSSLALVTEMSSNEFASTETMLAAINGDRAKNADGELFAQNTQQLFEKMIQIKKESRFWWNFYVQFYNGLNYNKHLETLSYFISQSVGNEDINHWIAENSLKVGAMIDWINENRY